MEFDLRLPSKMNLFNALSFCSYLESLDYQNIDTMIYNAEHISHVEPFGMLLVGAKLREIRRRYRDTKYEYYDIDNPNSYVGHMGFF